MTTDAIDTGIAAVATPLGGGDLTRAALAGAAPDSWYAPVPQSGDAWHARCRDVANADGEWLRALEPALGSGARLLERVARGGVVITTGQQAGLFGGPMYTVLKALTALELSREMERTTGVPAAPVFWAATDDADLAEAATTIVPGAAGAERLTVTAAHADGVPMSDTPLGDDVQALYEQLLAACGSSADARPLDAARAFAPGTTMGGAYVAMLRDLLEPLGITVLDASATAVAGASRDFLGRALRDSAAIHGALVERQRAIVDAGYTAQVDAERDLSLVFEWRPRGDGGHTKRRIPLDEAATAGSARLSPNVLLRPVTERQLLPTVAYVGGPGEIAYFSQVTAVARVLGAPAPLVVPRWSGMLIPDDTVASLARLGLMPDDLRDPHAAERRLAAAAVPKEATDAVAAMREALQREFLRLEGAMPPGVVTGLHGQFEIRVQKLERRLRAAAKHREQASMRLIAAARGVLYPLGKAQDRTLNAVPLWARFGDGFIDAIRPAIAAHARRIVTGAAPAA